jgi:sarcosine oxidase subunit beta
MREKASVVIIGGGIIGASVAYNLTQQGASDLVLFEKGTFGSGSTSASLGGFRHQFSSEASIKLSLESAKIIQEFETLTGYDPLVKRDGYLFVASAKESLGQLEKNRTLSLGLGVPVDLLDKEDLQRKFRFYNFEEIIGGTLCMRDGHASTAAVLQGFISKSREKGAELYENAEVTKIEKVSSNEYSISTALGKVRTEKLVIACGAYSGKVGKLASLDIPIYPLPRKILVTHPFRNGIPTEIPLIIDVDSTLAIGREGSGMIMADNQPSPLTFDLDSFPPGYDERVISLAVRRVPALKEASISYADIGLYEMTPDSNPIIGLVSSKPSAYCCAGFAGHGFMHAPAVGRLMSELLLEKQVHMDISYFGIQRFFAKQGSSKEGLII